MRHRHVLLRAGSITALVAPAISCTAVLGIEDPYLGCYLDPMYSTIASDSSTLLVYEAGPLETFYALEFKLGAHAPPHGPNPDATLTLTLTESSDPPLEFMARPEPYVLDKYDSRDSCSICITVEARFDTPTSTVSQEWWAFSGALKLDKIDPTGLKGTAEVTFQQMTTNTSSPTELEEFRNGCPLTIRKISFDVPGNIAAAR